MPEREDDLDGELGRMFREWTDSSERVTVWTDEAHGVLAATADQNRVPVRMLALVGGLAVIVVAAGLTIRYLAGPPDEAAQSNVPLPSPSQLASPTPAPTPTIIAGEDLPLSELAWWDEEHIAFGFIPEWTPPPNPPVQPPEHKLVHIGTLDGRLTAVVALNARWSHSYISGPVGTDVLIVNDVGGYSTVELVSALDGSRTVLFASDAIIPAAILSPDGSEIFYGKFNRTTGADEGLWRQPRNRDPYGLSETLVLAGPLGDPLDLSANNLTIWRLTSSLDGRTIVAQSCFGEVRCTSHFVDVSTGSARSIDAIGWVRGVTDYQVIASDLRVDFRRLVSVDLQTLEQNTVNVGPETMPVRVGVAWYLASSAGEVGTGETRLFSLDEEVEVPIPDDNPDQGGTGIRELMERKGVSLPEGWVIRWPDLLWAPPQNLDANAPAQLVNVITGERFLLSTFRADITNPACSLIPPAELPSGRPAGTFIQTLESGVLYAQWGSGQDVVFQAAGTVISPELESPESVDVTVRGIAGHAADVGGEFFWQGAFAWVEGGCEYSVWLAPGTPLESAIEYAGRF
jgi:hypothetical protein